MFRYYFRIPKSGQFKIGYNELYVVIIIYLLYHLWVCYNSELVLTVIVITKFGYIIQRVETIFDFPVESGVRGSHNHGDHKF